MYALICPNVPHAIIEITFEDDDQEIFKCNESDVEDYTWHYLFGIFVLKISKMPGACVT